MPDRRVAWFNCASGVAGDMILGSLLDAGASIDYITATVSELCVPGWSLGSERVTRSGISATQAIVQVKDDAVTRSYGAIAEILDEADLPLRVKERSHAAFLALATVEAAIHGIKLDNVHFHEVGGHDALVDIVGTMAGLEDLDIDDVMTSPIALGSGAIQTKHGTIPNPAPATIALLEGFEVLGTSLPFELATPTGAAILKVLATPLVPLPPMTVIAQGFGAGTRDLEHQANVVGVIVGICQEVTDEMVVLLETTVDDVSGEQLAAALSALLERGALDAWVTPASMKKGRAGSVLSVLTLPFESVRCTAEIMRRTGSLGVRSSLLMRSTLARRIEEVNVLGHRVHIKVSNVRAKPEFDDLVVVAEQTGRTIFEIEALSMAAFLEQEPTVEKD